MPVISFMAEKIIVEDPFGYFKNAFFFKQKPIIQTCNEIL